MAVLVEEVERQQEERLAEELHKCELRIKEDSETSGCRTAWDGILCWGRGAAGTLSAQPCPAYIVGFDPRANATRRCTETGWFLHPQGNTSWTNFTQCHNRQPAAIILDPPKSNTSHTEVHLPSLKIIATTGYTVSLISLLAAFCILATVKKLRCPRNTLHMHLFLSFIMRAFMTLLKNSLFVNGLGLSSDLTNTPEGVLFGRQNEENWECKLIISLWQYFIMANYSWILMEGLYLHNLIFLALFSDTSGITLYVTLGWGLPAVFVGAWVLCRLLLDNVVCWTVHRKPQLFLLIRVPIVASIILSFGLFVNIVRVLLLKLKASVCEETRRYRRWAKSTLVLVPLFGVHYTVFHGLSYSDHPQVELVYLYCDQFFASFQGFFVALLYCFLNGEVRAEVARKWRRLRRGAAPGAYLAGGSSFPGGTCVSLAGNASNGPARASLPQGGSRNAQQRVSCYSTSSCTSLSGLGVGGVAGGVAGPMAGAGAPPKRRSGGALDGVGNGDPRSGLVDHPHVQADLNATGHGLLNLSDFSGRPVGERRWSSRSDFSSPGSVMEMTTGNI